jgi:hypothetical protein
MKLFTCEASIATYANPAVTGSILANWTVCDEPGTDIYQYACQHEHVVTKVTCEQHKPISGEVGCKQCADLGHECEMTFRPIAHQGKLEDVTPGN